MQTQNTSGENCTNDYFLFYFTLFNLKVAGEILVMTFLDKTAYIRELSLVLLGRLLIMIVPLPSSI